jgi:hypothetical protein
MIEELRTRLKFLKQEFVSGEEQLGDLVRRETALRETLLRISGAIQVLQELIEAQDRGVEHEPSTSAPAGSAP